MNNATLTKAKIKRLLQKERRFLQEKYGVARIAVFGSFAKGEARRKSDVDILVQLTRPLGLDFVGLAFYLEKKLGKKVDLITRDTLRRSIKNPRYRHIAADIRRTMLYV